MNILKKRQSLKSRIKVFTSKTQEGRGGEQAGGRGKRGEPIKLKTKAKAKEEVNETTKS